MGRKASHHYIPVCYLSGFTNDGSKYGRFIAVTKKGKVYKTNPQDTCKERDYYTVHGKGDSLCVEEFYACEIEPCIKNALEYINKNERLPSKDNSSFLGLILLVATLLCRTKSVRTKNQEYMFELQNIISDMFIDGHGLSKSPSLTSKNNVVAMELVRLNRLIDSFSEMNYCLHIAKGAGLFITSDSPAVFDNDECELFVPINKNMAVIGRRNDITYCVMDATDGFIAKWNTKVAIISADLFISASDSILVLDQNEEAVQYQLKMKT